jgi:adenine-specific DNA-methyltransferase
MPRKPRVKYGAVPVEATVHKSDQRANIPTIELKDFAMREETAPYLLRYPRDPSLDPQLVWKGKDEQDAKDLEVPSVPVYIQEHIAPRAIIEDLRKEQQEGQPRQASLFADFNGMTLEKRVEFYQHAQRWTNRMVLGDSLLVMASLGEKEGLKSKVQMVYLDPPYGIKFGSNWQVSTRKRDVRDGRVEDATREPEQVKAFRDTWKLGIHSYLAYWRDRLVAARELLTETGSVFVQIGDENIHLVRSIMDEVFGSDNFVSQLSFAKTTGFSGRYLSNVCDYLVWYGKDVSQIKYRQLYKAKEAGEIGATAYRPLSEFPIDGGFWGKSDVTRLATSADLTSQGASPGSEQLVTFNGRDFLPPAGLHWKTTVTGLYRLITASRIFLVGNTLRYLRLLDDFGVYPISNTWTDTGIAGFTADKVYVVQTLPKVIERCMLMTTALVTWCWTPPAAVAPRPT